MSYVLTPEAEVELADAAAFCLQKLGPLVTKDFLDTFESKMQLIAEFPGLGTTTSQGRCMFPLGRYPFSVLYRVDGEVVRISAIAHHSRRPGYWTRRK